jgi:4-amino-4-deoxy-L-arabinose transferase-like glycosyltransferase
LVGISDWLGFRLWGVVIIQLIAAAAALWFVFDLGRSVGGEWAGFWAAVPVATFLDFTQWHHFILTDSLSASLTVSCVWLLYRSYAGSVWWPYFFLLPLLTVGALLRPNGWLVVLLAIVAIAFSFSATWLVRGLTAAGGAMILLLVVPLTPSFSVSLDAESPANQVLEGRVIWGAEQTYKEMPAAQVDSPGYIGVIQYAIAQPGAYVGLMASRVGWEMAGVRPHFSLAHNAYVGLYLVPIYFFSLISIVRYWRHPVVVLCASAFALHMGLVAITFADWSGRFLTYAWPLLCVCFGAGLTSLVNQKSLNR